jgi:RNA-binding protein NOB1
MASHTAKTIHSLVIDAGPIIKNEPSISTLLGQAESIYTVPAVIDEIRDATTRARVETTLLPFLKLRSPRPASIKIITDFSRKTGDLEVMSKPDIQLLALAYELECERNHGDWRLRSVPGQKRLNGAPPVLSTNLYQEPVAESQEVHAKFEREPALDSRGAWGTAKPFVSEVSSEFDEVKSGKGAESLDIPEPTEDTIIQNEDAITGPVADALEQLALEEVAATESEESDGEGWITPSNIKKHQAKDLDATSEPLEEPKIMQVATITTDFAMQNVLLRMNLNLLSPSLQRIRQLKTWVLRCHACFAVTKDMSKQFCNRCGKPTLLRTSCSTDKDGNFKVHLKKNMQWSTRGNVYSIPKLVAGSSNGRIVSGGGKGGWGQELILAEDQKEYVQAMTTARRKKEKDLMDEDYLPSILSGDRRGPSGRPKVGAGKNVNSKKRNK